jgi:2-oxoisovalerate dehydrogenase E2 component (dihydrolipoyl transacylase)
MPVELEMPELAESVIEGEIVKWLVKEGDHVKQDQPLVEVMTDKVTVEIPSPYEGVLLKQVAPEGAVVAIGKPIAIFGKEGETIESVASDKAAASAKAVSPDPPAAPAVSPREAVVSAEIKPGGNGQAGAAASKGPAELATLSPSGKPLATPAVRKFARELGVDLTRVRGSGEGGRIRREDVQRVASSGAAAAPGVGSAAAAAARPVAAGPSGETERVPLRGLRRIIAEHMVHSKHTAAHTLHVDEADVTELVAMRNRAKGIAAERGVKLTFLPFFVKSACAALIKHPFMNASLDEEKHEIVLKKDYNIGIAVNTDGGLVVPVIHAADRMSIFDLARAIADLADKARTGKLAHDEITGGTFTITNVGSVGGLFTFPIINWPEVGILGTHSIQKRPVVRDGQIVIRDMTYLSISFDHRVVDGAVAAQFVKDIVDLLAAPDVFLMESGSWA